MRVLLLLLLTACQCPTILAQTQKTTQMSHVETFADNYDIFKMNIQAAGVAQIPAATFKNNVLTIDYAYFSQGEQRKGTMILTFEEATGRFQGNWQTNADNGNVYKGSLYFLFEGNGEASGQYTYANQDFNITIFKVLK